ncbi:hypothetical protein SAMN02799630_01240 [Paenibacillus sp. UNCCL117]|uniref:hypothetical protein n=1 Tax=unclassified Paenibacillus TaxID=185978 RepID=UPI000882A1F4|nr:MULTISPECIES: hypothetical protein [unclassified Paenibacillus]SDC70637.1 hypothetical protein SAMN04488602_103218 [Paenibacillus sp. cl123]SFW24254.1 hypothetical protein SAMN02799630_01240 [Paenibacillus sp. UNCCL117]
MQKGDQVRNHGDSVMHGSEGEVVEVLDGFIRVKFVNWGGPFVVKIYEGYVRPAAAQGA